MKYHKFLNYKMLVVYRYPNTPIRPLQVQRAMRMSVHFKTGMNYDV